MTRIFNENDEEYTLEDVKEYFTYLVERIDKLEKTVEGLCKLEKHRWKHLFEPTSEEIISSKNLVKSKDD